jgi:hypothetical protein
VEKSRLKASSQEAKQLSEQQVAECWFLTLQAHHVCVLPILGRYQRQLRALK